MEIIWCIMTADWQAVAQDNEMGERMKGDELK